MKKIRMQRPSNHAIVSNAIIVALAVIGGLAAIATQAQETPSIQFSEHLVAGDYAYAYGIAAADFDQDGDLDLSSADYTPHNKLYLFENDGQGVFKKHVIQNNDPERLERHMVGDLDNDGDLDIVIVKNLHGHLLWFENGPSPSDATPNDDTLWTRHVITTNLPGAYDVALADFNHDGLLDVAASSWILGNQFAWFENPGNASGNEWKKHPIEKNISETRTIRTADFDNDGDPDLLGTIRQEKTVVWYENRKQGNHISWTRHIIDNQSPFPAHGNPVDMDHDGDLDVVMALGFYFKPDSNEEAASKLHEENQIVWYENESPKSGRWKKHVIEAKFDDAFEAIAADLDLDGDIDVVATSWRNPGRLAWFENLGDPRKTWKRHLLKENWRSANQVIIADFNRDGKPDIAASAERGSVEVRWWKNEGRPKKP